MQRIRKLCTMPRRGVLGRVAAWLRGERGAVTPIMAVMIVPIVGTFAMGVEVGNWYFTQRSMQNAADTAAIAAASNACLPGATPSCGATYATEARAAAQRYGFQNGVNNVTITPSTTTASPCPAGSTCFQVTISKPVALYLARIVGFNGSQALGTGRAQLVSASAMAAAKTAGASSYCILALAPTGEAVRKNGGSANLENCGLQVNSSSADALRMNGGSITADAIDVVGNYSANGTSINVPGGVSTGQAVVPDPYAGLFNANNAGAESVGTPRNITAAGNYSIASGYKVIGNIDLNGNKDVTLDPGVYYVRGSISLNGNSTVSGTGVTLVLTCSNPPACGAGSTWGSVSLNGNGARLNIAAPASGPWSGMAIYQDPRRPAGSSISFNGTGSTTLGVLYFPTQDLVFNGGTTDCTQLVAFRITLNGGARNNNCVAAGVTPIGGSAAVRASLIF